MIGFMGIMGLTVGIVFAVAVIVDWRGSKPPKVPHPIYPLTKVFIDMDPTTRTINISSGDGSEVEVHQERNGLHYIHTTPVLSIPFLSSGLTGWENNLTVWENNGVSDEDFEEFRRKLLEGK